MSSKYLSIFTGQGHISEVIVRPQISEGSADVLLEVFPVEAEFLRGGHLSSLQYQLTRKVKVISNLKMIISDL